MNKRRRLTKRQRLVACMLAIFIIVAFTAWTNYRLLKTQKINQITLDESEILSRGSSLFSRELGHLKSMTLFLRNTVEAKLLSTPISPQSLLQQAPSQNTFPKNDQSKSDQSKDGQWEKATLEVFTQFAKTSPLISQVRWLDLQGNERIRLNVSKGQSSAVEVSHLQNKSTRYYFQQAAYAVGNHVYISPIDLNVEHGKVVMPIEPTVRAVITLDKKLGGILVVNYNLTELFYSLRRLANKTVFLDLVNFQGEWVISQDRSQEWSLTLNQSDKNSVTEKNVLSLLYPKVWKNLLADDGLSSFIESGQIWSAMRVTLEDDSPDMSHEKETYLYFVARTWPNVLSEYHYSLLILIGGISLVLYLFFVWIAWWFIAVQDKRLALLNALEIEKVHLKNTNKELNASNQQLVMLQDELVENSRLSSLGLMVAGLAHEMNTPLGGVKMAMSSLNALLQREATHLPESSYGSLQSSINIADKNLSRAIELVSSFKRLTSNQTNQEARSFEFAQVMDDLLLTYKPVFKKTPHINVITKIPSGLSMTGHPGVLMQVMQNLIDNALTYAFDEDQKGTLTIEATCDDKNLTLTIQDSGKGVDPSIIKQLFDPFITMGRGQAHTGLGLYLVHQWVSKLMAGHIDVTSEQGKGTCFSLIIPLNWEKA